MITRGLCVCWLLAAFFPTLTYAFQETRSLAGDWFVTPDRADVGERHFWPTHGAPHTLTCRLPGTLAQAGIGYLIDLETMLYPLDVLQVLWPGTKPTPRADEAGTLSTDWIFVGKAWYEREIEIPDRWKNRPVQLRLERVLWATKVWIDGRCLGEYDSLAAEHRYDMGTLNPGKHQLTVRVDNGLVHNIGVIGHSYGPETQSRWNGVVGAIELIATDPVYFERLRLDPAADRQSVQVRATLQNTLPQTVTNEVQWSILAEKNRDRFGLSSSTVVLVPGRNVVEHRVPVARTVEGWDEFHPIRYRVEAVMKPADSAGPVMHEIRQAFGFRHIERDGRHIKINGRRVFLRGTLDCCVYPRTGHPPMTVDEWTRVFKIIREHGFNHVRYHTWCPPEAAFEAADRMGLYLAPETPFWVDDWTVNNTPTHPQPLGRDPDTLGYVRHEIQRISDAYGNHPSFALFCVGNEFGMNGTDWTRVHDLLAEAKTYDHRRLYNASTARKPVNADDYWATHNTGNHATRGPGGPSTDWDFSAAARSTDLPLIGHETGQRPVFPNYDRLLPKFTGVLKPYNYERLRHRLQRSGLEGQTAEFERASAKFQLLQYKAEHEAMLRTPDYAGYQLLMLNDFTGQSEALVGMLDPFWESKGVITPSEVRQWNSPTVPLARFSRYTWTSDRTFEASIDLAHFGPTPLTNALIAWSLKTTNGKILAEGRFNPAIVPTGELTTLGGIRAPLTNVNQATAMMLRVKAGKFANQWTLWAYPSEALESDPGEVVICRKYDATAQQALAEGRRVMLLAHGMKNEHAARTGFFSVYWSAGWWGNAFSSLGILCDPREPALRDFPQQGYSDWQWRELTEGATTFLLNDAPKGWRPIVQAVPDFHYPGLLAQVFELRSGSGGLLVVGYDLDRDLPHRPAARQMRASLLRYMNSAAFSPKQTVDSARLRQWLK